MTIDAKRSPEHQAGQDILTRRLSLIARISSCVVTTAALEEVAQIIVREVKAVFQVDVCVLRVLEGEELVLVAQTGAPEGLLFPRIPANEGIAAELISTARPVVISNARKDEVTAVLAATSKPVRAFRFTSYAGAPLLFEGRLIGILGIYTATEERIFPPIDLDHLQIIANQIALCMAGNQFYKNMKAQQDDLRRAHDELDVRVRERTAEVVRANEKLTEEIFQRKKAEAELRDALHAAQQATRAKATFLANMSHEIRTPMNAVIGMSQLLAHTNLSPEQSEYCRTIDESGQLLIEIIDEILEFSKLEAGKVRLRNQDFDIRDLLDGIMKVFHARTEEKGIALNLTVMPRVPARIHGDPIRLRQVLINLVGNAVKFTQEGSVAVECSVMSAASDDLVLQFSVRDTGIGIPSDKIGRLFKSFSQVETSSSRNFGGTGLGLAICKKLLELMDGTVDVESVPGRGSLFWFTIPMTPGDSKADTRGEKAKREQLNGFSLPSHARVLLVEDHAVNQRLVQAILEKAGVKTCDIAANGRDALQLLAVQNYDLILMDCQMPVMDGYEATQLIRKGEENSGRRIPIVALTANVLEGESERCIACGMDAYLSKPIRVDDFFRVIGSCLARKSP